MKKHFKLIGVKLTLAAFSLLLALVPASKTSASHLVGGEITYQWISGNQYLIKLTLYRDCQGLGAPLTPTINYASSCWPSGSISLTAFGIPEIVTPVCGASQPLSSCNGGTLYSVKKYTYQTVFTLPVACSNWRFSYDECCRNAAVTNLQNSSSIDLYLETTLNNFNFPFNNSVSFSSNPSNVIPNNTTSTLNWNTYDVDGDSLVYELVPAKVGSVTNATYAPGFSATQPFNASLPTTLGNSGIMTVTPATQQISVVCMKVSEYRQGILIGQVSRDYQIAVFNSTNTPPSLTGINGANIFQINGCPGDTIEFTVTGSDPDAGQTLTLSMNGPSVGAAFNVIPGTNPSGTFTWLVDTGDVSSQPYVFAITASDDHCDYFGSYSNAFYVYVNGCNTNDVWPGDANADGTANLYDLLAIGLAYNETGPVRANASLNWVAQPASDWSNYFVSGVNHKHADTDGNGSVNADDTTAIMLNYGLSHPLRLQGLLSQNPVDLVVNASFDTVGTMATVDFDISINTPVDSIYGLAFRIFFDPALVDMGTATVTYPGSIFGTPGVDMIRLDKTHQLSGFVDVALSRIDHQNISGTGPVARITIVTTDNVSGKVTLNVQPTDVDAITAHEYPIVVNSIGDEVVIDPNFTGVADDMRSLGINVYPVPSGDHLIFENTGAGTVQHIRITDLRGKEVMVISDPGQQQRIDIRSLDKGIYFLHAETGNRIAIQKIVKI